MLFFVNGTSKGLPTDWGVWDSLDLAWVILSISVEKASFQAIVWIRRYRQLTTNFMRLILEIFLPDEICLAFNMNQY